MKTDKRSLLFSVIILFVNLISGYSFAESSGDIAKDIIKDIIADVNCIKRDQAWKYIKRGGDSGCDFLEKKEPCSIANRVGWWITTKFLVKEEMINSPWPVCFEIGKTNLENKITRKFIELNRKILNPVKNKKQFTLESLVDQNEDKETIGKPRISTVTGEHEGKFFFQCKPLLVKEISNGSDRARKIYYEEGNTCHRQKE